MGLLGVRQPVSTSGLRADWLVDGRQLGSRQWADNRWGGGCWTTVGWRTVGQLAFRE
ncbi:hypothetical protein GCM10010452_62760 [Crossiella cryophila]